MTDQTSVPSPPSLYFISTQIQSRHEDLEERDSKISQLQKFKSTSPVLRDAEPKVVKRIKRGKRPKLNSISSFVRDTFGAKGADPKSIMEYFSGDSSKVESFLARIDSATASKHVLSGSSSSLLFSSSEWRLLLESIKLKFPNLSSKNKKTLKVISRRLEEIKSIQTTQSQDSGSENMWSQASRLPSDKLSTEDMKWLYDLDEEQLNNDVTVDYLDPEPANPLTFTLSQILDPIDSLDEAVPNSQSDIEAFDETTLVTQTQPERDKMADVVNSAGMGDWSPEPSPRIPSSPSQTSRQFPSLIPSHQNVEEVSVDVLTSIAFAPTFDKKPKLQNSPVKVFSSPIKSCDEEFKTPSKWPSTMQITSSPLSRDSSVKELFPESQGDQEVYLTARTGIMDRQSQGVKLSLRSQPSDLVSIDLSPLKSKRVVNYEVEEVEYLGTVDLRQNSTSPVHLRKVRTVTAPPDAIPDSEDDEAELSIIEITKPVQESPEISVLQVPSSPGT